MVEIKNTKNMTLGIDLTNIKTGGGLTHICELLTVVEPQKYGFEQIIIWCHPMVSDKIPSRKWVKIIHYPTARWSFVQFWQRMIHLPKLVKNECTLLFCPGGSFISSRVRYVSMSQNMLVFEPKERDRFKYSFNWLRIILLAQLQKKSFNRAKGIIFISNYAKKAISPFLTKSTAECPVIYHGIAPRFRNIYGGKSQIKEQNKPLDILYISTISMYKHQWKVVEAVAKLVNEGYPIRLNLVGDYYPPALKILRKTLEQFDPNQQFVTLTGAIPFENINHYYQKADIFVFASTCENMPNILVEAMASELAIAASMYEPMPEILKDAALYFDPLNPIDIYGKLKILIESPQKRLEIGTKAKKYAAAYSWERCAHETFSYLQKIANYTAITPKNAVEFHSETALQFSEKYYLSKPFQARFLVWTTLFEKYIQSPKMVLDVGCGSGIFSIYLAQKKCKVIGIDGSKKMIELCKQSNTTLATYLTFHQMQLPWFNPQPFVGTEVIVCSSVLEYIADYQNVIADFANLLPSGGLLIVSMPNAESWYRILEKYIYQLFGKPHYYQFIQHIISEKMFTELLYSHNFTLKEIIYYPCTDLLSKTLNRVGFTKKYTNTMFVGVYQRN